MNNNLFEDSDDGSLSNFQLNTNKQYAQSYNNLRKKELLQKFKEEDGDQSDCSSSDTSDSTEDEDLSDPVFDEEFLKALASLKRKDPKIYDKSTKFFDNERKKEMVKKDKSKPVTLKDYERQIILEKGGKYDDENNAESPYETEKRQMSPSIAEEEKKLKHEFREIVHASDNNDGSEDEFGGIFKKRAQTKEEPKKEEDFFSWLAGKQDTVKEDIKKQLEPLKSYWNNSSLPQSEKFLRDYILNKGYAQATNYNEIPTYSEIVADDMPLSEDEKELEKQAEFEQKYNFRFEEPDQEFIKRYPRIIDNSVRRVDDKRKLKRLQIKERKEQEKKEKIKQLELVKELKRKDIQEKIHKLKLVTGNDELGFHENEFDEEFDPDAHDKRMQEIFNDEYYEMDEGEEKPECPSDIEELKTEDWDSYDPQKDNDEEKCEYDEPNCEDEDFNMDCDYDPQRAKAQLEKELIDSTKSRRQRKGRRNRFKDIIKAEKPVFNPEDEKTYAEYIDEYYKLDCEDIIGDIPCRFKYVETTPNDFGLTIEEILMAKNKELNQWVSLKKAVQIRPEHLEKKEQRIYKAKAKNVDLKRKIFKSIYGDGSDDEKDEQNIAELESNKSDKSKHTSKQCTASTIQPREDEDKEKNCLHNEAENLSHKKRHLEDHSSNVKKTNRGKGKLVKLDQQQVAKEEKNVINKDHRVKKTQNPFKNKLKTQKPETPQAGKTKEGIKRTVNKNKPSITLETTGQEITADRLKAYGINPRKFQKKLNFRKRHKS